MRSTTNVTTMGTHHPGCRTEHLDDARRVRYSARTSRRPRPCSPGASEMRGTPWSCGGKPLVTDNAPDVFADSVNIGGGPFGVALTFMLTDPAQPADADARAIVARVRMTPDLARALAEALRQAVPTPAAASER